MIAELDNLQNILYKLADWNGIDISELNEEFGLVNSFDALYEFVAEKEDE